MFNVTCTRCGKTHALAEVFKRVSIGDRWDAEPNGAEFECPYCFDRQSVYES